MKSKNELGVNGEHMRLGKEFSMLEFKGFTVAKIDSIEKMVIKIEESMNDRIKKCEVDISSLKVFENRLIGIAIAIGAIAGVAGNWVISVMLKIIGR